MNCKYCEYYKSTYPDKGYCKLWDEYVKESDNCEEWSAIWV